jgi:serine/threonine-protein kinase
MPTSINLPVTESRRSDPQSDQATLYIDECPAEPLPSCNGRYVVTGEIARGGMGAILKGRDPDLNREIAIKVLLQAHTTDADLTRRFLDEAQIAGQLQHPGVVPVYELGRFRDGCPYFTMKLVEGKTLATLLFERNLLPTSQSNPGARRSPEDLPRFLKIFEQICQTIAYAHSFGVIHRDLKPANIMVGNFGEVQVMDWGLAKVLSTSDSPVEQPSRLFPVLSRQGDAQQTEAGQIMGTPAYMAPEQARSEPTDERADVFGLGAILCEILTGRAPFNGPDTSEVVQASARGDLREAQHGLQASGTDPELITLALQCLEADPTRRPRNAGEVARKVTEYRNSVDARLRQAEMDRAAAEVRAAAERKNRKLSWWLAAAIVGLAVICSVGWYVIQKQANQRRAEEARRDFERHKGVESALTKSAELRRASRFHEARGLLEQTQIDIGAVAPGDLRARLAQEISELNLIEHLEGIRLKLLSPNLGPIEFAQGGRAYREFFTEQNFGTLGDDPEEVAMRIRQSPVREQLVAALDDWSRCVEKDQRSWVLGVARKADPDEWRDRFRDPKAWESASALEKLAKSAKVEHLSPPSIVALGHTLALLNGDATSLLLAAQRLHPDDFWINMTLAYALQKTGNSAAAVGYYRAALAIRPEVATAHANLGSALCLSGQPDVGIAELRQAIATDPTYHQFHLNLGTILRLQNRLPEAADELTKATVCNPKSVEAWVGLGEVKLMQDRFKEAEGQFRRALEIDRGNARAKANLASIMHRYGRFDDAIAMFRESVKVDPSLSEAHVGLGICLHMKGRFADAINAFELALKLKPESAKALASLGASLHASGKNDEAQAVWTKALAIDPKNATVMSYLGVATTVAGQYEKGIDLCRRAVALNPDDFNTCYSLGQVLGMTCSFSEAKVQLRRGIALLPPNHPQRASLERIAAIYEGNVELEKKLQKVLDGESKPANAAESLKFAKICFFQKQYRRSAELYAEGLSADSKTANGTPLNHRYLAACAAAMAASTTDSNDAERAKLRKEAITWLNEELMNLGKQSAANRSTVRRAIQLWQKCSHLQSLRDPAAISNLPLDERRECTRFWSDVASLSKRIAD